MLRRFTQFKIAQLKLDRIVMYAVGMSCIVVTMMLWHPLVVQHQVLLSHAVAPTHRNLQSIGVQWSLLSGALVYAIILIALTLKHRQRAKAGTPLLQSLLVDIGWTCIPALIFFLLIFLAGM